MPAAPEPLLDALAGRPQASAWRSRSSIHPRSDRPAVSVLGKTAARQGSDGRQKPTYSKLLGWRKSRQRADFLLVTEAKQALLPWQAKAQPLLALADLHHESGSIWRALCGRLGFPQAALGNGVLGWALAACGLAQLRPKCCRTCAVSTAGGRVLARNRPECRRSHSALVHRRSRGTGWQPGL